MAADIRCGMCPGGSGEGVSCRCWTYETAVILGKEVKVGFLGKE